jgi:exoribonuclease R
METIYHFEVHKDYENVCKALHGDIVYIEDEKVIRIIERKKHKIPGVLLCDSKTKYGLYKNKLLYLFKPHNPTYPDFYVPSKYENDLHKKYTYIEFLEWKDSLKCPIGIVLDYIGNVGDKMAEYQYLRYIHNIQHIKDCKVDKEKYEKDKALHQSIQSKSADYDVFSIDPIGCVDIDDAFHFKYNESENS